ncbi:MAG: hypothetical protein U1F43_26155 [Myxococcota bacterium]
MTALALALATVLQTFQVPVRLRLVAADGRATVSYAREDTEPLALEVAPGAFLGARVTRDGGSVTLGGVRPLTGPEDPNPIDGLFDYAGGVLDHSYRLELFVTDVPPGHKWTPEAKGYRVLWSRTLTIHASEDEVRRATR